jgi:Icc-related predicted phosphoesterase
VSLGRSVWLLAAMLAGGCRSQARAAGGSAAAATSGAAVEPWSCGAVHGEARSSRRLGRAGRLVLGATADFHGDAEGAARAAHLFGREGVDAVLALGDLGGDEDQVTRVLVALGATGVPLMALAGEAEPEAAFHAAVKRARAGGIDVVDLVDLRLVDLGDVAIVSAPGYRYSRHGCHYEARDLDGVRSLAATAGKPLVLAAHAPPRDEGPEAIDRGFGDADVGDPEMRALVDGLAPAAALFAHVDEAGGRTHGRWLNVGNRLARLEVAGGRVTTRVLP